MCVFMLLKYYAFILDNKGRPWSSREEDDDDEVERTVWLIQIQKGIIKGMTTCW